MTAFSKVSVDFVCFWPTDIHIKALPPALGFLESTSLRLIYPIFTIYYTIYFILPSSYFEIKSEVKFLYS